MSLKHFISLHHLMIENEIILSYSGEVSQPLTKTLLAFTERKFAEDNLEDLVKRKIFNIMVEMLQNISKNSLDNTAAITPTSPLFIIGENDKHFMLLSSNQVNEDNIDNIKSRIDQVNSLDADGLKKLYKQVRLEGKFSDVGGAGIGFIDMARKSENKMEYDFHKIRDTGTLYTLLIKVNKTLK